MDSAEDSTVNSLGIGLEIKKTTNAKKMEKNWIAEKLKVACWNVRSISNKEEELVRILKKNDISIAVISETKKKLRGSKDVGTYVMLYSGVKLNERASKGVAVFTDDKWKSRIRSYEFLNERIITIRFGIDRGNLTVTAVYALENGKEQESEELYLTLQKLVTKYDQSDNILILGDINARVGKLAIPKVVGQYGEQVINENGEILRQFVLFNELKIANTFFRKKDIHKYTKYGGYLLHLRLLHLYNTCWKNLEVPKQWKNIKNYTIV